MGCTNSKIVQPSNGFNTHRSNRPARVTTANDFSPTRRPEEAIENLENVTLIWLDQSINETNEDCKKTLLLLREIYDFLLVYTDSQSCVEKIKSIDKEIVLLIVSGSLSKDVLPKIHSFPQLDSVFIFCTHRSVYEHMKQDYSAKVVDIFTEQELLMQSIHQQRSLIAKHTMAFSFFNQKQNASRDLTTEAASFLWFQLLFSVLKELHHSEGTKNEMLAKCEQYYRGNQSELQNIERFRKTYEAKDAIAWYTDECFVYRLVNKALRTEDIDGLYLFRFYIIDLCKQLEEESRKNVGAMNLYRGQVMSEEELNKLKYCVSSLISTNGFFSTTLVKHVATDFVARSKAKRPELLPVLFEITADSNVKSVIFADIEEFSRIQGEHEILFSVGAVFKITNVKFSDEMNCWIVTMNVIDEAMKDVQEYIDVTTKQYENTNNSIVFGWLLTKMNLLTKAEKYFNLLLATVEKESLEEADMLIEMGSICMRRSQHSSALDYYNHAYKIREHLLLSNHPKISSSLRSLGNVCRRTGDCEKAIQYYKRSLNIERENYNEIARINIAKDLQNLGQAYRKKGESETALEYFAEALQMRRDFLPKEHSDIASSLWDIGGIYSFQKDYDKALLYFFDALKIFQKTLPAGHPKMSRLFVAIADAYNGKKDYEAAFNFCQKKLIELHNELGESHPSIGRILFQIGDIHQKCVENNQALSYYEKALSIFEKCKPPEQEQIYDSLNRIAFIQEHIGNYYRALDCYSKGLEVGWKMYLPDEPKIGHTLCNIGRVHSKLKNYTEAMSYFDDAMKIFRRKYSDDHADIKATLEDIDKVKKAQNSNKQENSE